MRKGKFITVKFPKQCAGQKLEAAIKSWQEQNSGWQYLSQSEGKEGTY